MPWHLTPADNVASILRKGLVPDIGDRSAMAGEEVPAVYLFSSFDDLIDGGWIDDAFEEDEQLALFHVAIPAQPGAWTEITETIPPGRLQLIARDFDEVLDRPAYQALDKVVDPLLNVAAFRETRVEMRAEDFGEMVSDPQWEGNETVFLVYGASHYIVKRDDGLHELSIESEGWLEGHDGETLESLEQHLFDWVRREMPGHSLDAPPPEP